MGRFFRLLPKTEKRKPWCSCTVIIKVCIFFFFSKLFSQYLKMELCLYDRKIKYVYAIKKLFPFFLMIFFAAELSLMTDVRCGFEKHFFPNL